MKPLVIPAALLVLAGPGYAEEKSGVEKAAESVGRAFEGAAKNVGRAAKRTGDNVWIKKEPKKAPKKKAD
jgi:hypothetical protein